MIKVNEIEYKRSFSGLLTLNRSLHTDYRTTKEIWQPEIGIKKGSAKNCRAVPKELISISFKF